MQGTDPEVCAEFNKKYSQSPTDGPVIHCFELRSGAELWSQPLEDSWPVTPSVLTDGHLVVTRTGDQVSALDLQSGRALWRWPSGVWLEAAPALWEDQVLVVDAGGVLWSLDLLDGQVRWQRSGFGGARTLVAADGLALMGDNRGALTATVLGEDKMLWHHQVSDAPLLSVRPTETGELLCSALQHHLICLQADE